MTTSILETVNERALRWQRLRGATEKAVLSDAVGAVHDR